MAASSSRFLRASSSKTKLEVLDIIKMTGASMKSRMTPDVKKGTLGSFRTAYFCILSLDVSLIYGHSCANDNSGHYGIMTRWFLTGTPFYKEAPVRNTHKRGVLEWMVLVWWTMMRSREIVMGKLCRDIFFPPRTASDYTRVLKYFFPVEYAIKFYNRRILKIFCLFLLIVSFLFSFFYKEI